MLCERNLKSISFLGSYNTIFDRITYIITQKHAFCKAIIEDKTESMMLMSVMPGHIKPHVN